MECVKSSLSLWVCVLMFIIRPQDTGCKHWGVCVSEFSVKNKLLLPLRTSVITTVESKATTTPRSALGFVQGLGNTQHFISFLHTWRFWNISSAVASWCSLFTLRLYFHCSVLFLCPDAFIFITRPLISVPVFWLAQWFRQNPAAALPDRASGTVGRWRPRSLQTRGPEGQRSPWLWLHVQHHHHRHAAGPGPGPSSCWTLQDQSVGRWQLSILNIYFLSWSCLFNVWSVWKHFIITVKH